MRCAVALLGLGMLLPARFAFAEALDLSVNASVSVRPTQGVGYQGWLQLSVGWEALLFGRPPATRASESLAQSNDAPAETGGAPAAGAGAPAPTAEARPRLVQPWLRPAFALELVRAVMRQSESRDGELGSLATRSRTSALLPALRLRAGRGTDQSLRYSPTVDDPDRWLVSGAADYNYEAQASWTFDRLVFADDEIAIERLRQQAARFRGERALRALKLLFAWQRAWVRLRFGELEIEELWKAELELLQARAELDVLSTGWFSEQLAKWDPEL